MPTKTKWGTEKMQRRFVRGAEYLVRNGSGSLARRVVFVGRYKDGNEERLLFRPLKQASKFRSKG